MYMPRRFPCRRTACSVMARKRRTGLSAQSKEGVPASGDSAGKSPRATVPRRASRGKEVSSAQILHGSGLLSVSLLPALERSCSVPVSAPQPFAIA